MFLYLLCFVACVLWFWLSGFLDFAYFACLVFVVWGVTFCGCLLFVCTDFACYLLLYDCLVCCLGDFFGVLVVYLVVMVLLWVICLLVCLFMFGFQVAMLLCGCFTFGLLVFARVFCLVLMYLWFCV